MSEIEKINRTESVEKAWELYQKGMSYTKIGNEIGRHRNTVSEYIKEYAESMDVGGIEFQRRVSIAQLRKVIEHGWDLLENGNIKDSSLTRPQLLHQITQAVKEIDRITGLHVTQMQIAHEHRTVADIITSVNEQGYWDVINGEGIEEADYEIIEDNKPDTSS
jgi:hypothetical protein